MAAVSSLGVGSNLDLSSLLANIKSAEQAPLVALQQQQRSYTSKLSAYGQLSSALSALQTAAAALAKPALYTGVKATSSATDVLTASALSTAASGSYALNVTQLTQAQSLAATGVASTTAAIGAGAATTVTLDFGTISGGTLDPATGKYAGATFTADGARTATSITIDSSNNTLAGIRDAINASTAVGVTASIVNDGSATPNRLVLTSRQSGETSSMRIAVTGDAAVSGLLANDPAATQNLQQTAVAQNTKLTVNGIAITSATNTVAGAIRDVTMTVAKVGASTLSVQQDTGGVQSAVTTFVNAYNSLQNVAKQLTAFDAASKSGAVLLGDSTLRNIQISIRSALTTAQVPDSSGLAMMSQIGVAFQKDGTLSIDSTKLSTALGSQMSGVAKLFSGTAGVGGYGAQMSSLITGMTDSNGTLTAATKGINTTLDSLGKQYTATSARIDATVARYKAQFTQLDVMMSGMSRTSSYLTQQFDALNNTSKN
ncbi:flagellar filament capping protein FliD [Polaromonas sp.]|jgi:flagellar hook-associated protein 2|uniref:flagellar filament capping protein FliD n=1 Tax=Polaromonas sp. TaxID=1869339 RepID=UPI0037C7F7AA